MGAPLEAGRRGVACWALVLLAAAVAGCDRGPQGPQELETRGIWVTTPNEGDQAVVVAFQVPVDSFVPAPGFTHFQHRDPTRNLLLLVAESPLVPGEAWVGTASLQGGGAITARVVEVARSDYRTRESLDGYRVTVRSD
jgi:hypothetical protein